MSALDAVAPFVAQLRWDPRRGLRFLRERAWVSEDAHSVLAEWLYQRLFIDWKQPRGRFAHDVAGAPWFVEQLHQRSGDATFLQSGFTLTQRTPQGVFAANEHVRLWLEEPRSFLPPRARVGQSVKVRIPCARPALVPGFFAVSSRAGRLPGDPHLKLYVNVTPAGALELVDGLVHAPALRHVRFDAKVVNDPDGFGRRDTALLYVHPPAFETVVQWLRALERRKPRGFRSGTPPFTMKLSRAISAAESPLGEESFGAHRCALVARALLRALQRDTSWREEVRAEFSAQSLDGEAPWLGSLPAAWTRV